MAFIVQLKLLSTGRTARPTTATALKVEFSSEGKMELSSKDERAISPKRDLENPPHHEARTAKHTSAFKNLGILDRFLAIWILLAMVVGILLGNFVPETGPALQRGQFVGVSVPIGSHDLVSLGQSCCADVVSNRLAGHDVPHPLQGPI